MRAASLPLLLPLLALVVLLAAAGPVSARQLRAVEQDPSSSTDRPSYTVLQELNSTGIELRNYSAGQWVSTNVDGLAYDKAVSRGFTRLFAYISGANAANLSISMTAPVRVRAVPGEGPFCESHFKISFYVPHALQGKAPAPTSNDVFLDASPETRFFVSSYPGFSSEAVLIQKARSTIAALDKAGLTSKYNASYFYSAGYDSPFKLTNRHNEVWIPAV